MLWITLLTPAAMAAATTTMMMAMKSLGRKAMIAVRRTLIGLGPKALNASCSVKSSTK